MYKGVKLKVTLLILLTVLIGFIAFVLIDNYLKAEPEVLDSTPIVEDKVPDFMSKSPKDGLMDALVYYEVAHPDIVYAQAVLETGWFTSNLCINYHNLFGLYNSKKLQYYKFNHWTESLVAYVKFVQYKYNPTEDYYDFLTRIGYAEDKDYISKVKNITNRLQDDKRRYIEGCTITTRL